MNILRQLQSRIDRRSDKLHAWEVVAKEFIGKEDRETLRAMMQDQALDKRCYGLILRLMGACSESEES